MKFKKIVDGLLEADERTVSWLGRKLNRSPQNMRHALLSDNPPIKLIKEVAEVFNLTEVEFIELEEKH